MHTFSQQQHVKLAVCSSFSSTHCIHGLETHTNMEKFHIRTRYTHAHHFPHAKHMESSIRRNGDGQSTVETMPCCASAYPIHGSASQVNRLGANAQVVSCHGYLVFHPFVEQLTVSYVSRLVLALSSILRILNLDATSR